MTADPKPQARHKADRLEWERIVRDKRGPCRVCVLPSSNGSYWHQIELHHIVPRSRGGDDVAENIAPLCRYCHGLVTAYDPDAQEALAKSLTDEEHEYIAAKLGPHGLERLFGVSRG